MIQVNACDEKYVYLLIHIFAFAQFGFVIAYQIFAVCSMTSLFNKIVKRFNETRISSWIFQYTYTSYLFATSI